MLCFLVTKAQKKEVKSISPISYFHSFRTRIKHNLFIGTEFLMRNRYLSKKVQFTTALWYWRMESCFSRRAGARPLCDCRKQRPRGVLSVSFETQVPVLQGLWTKARSPSTGARQHRRVMPLVLGVACRHLSLRTATVPHTDPNGRTGRWILKADCSKNQLVLTVWRSRQFTDLVSWCLLK